MNPRVKLFEDILANAVFANDEALIELKKNVLKNRSDAKLNKQIIIRALSNYAKYGQNLRLLILLLKVN